MEILRSALEHAVRAPSGHNTQPWLFRIAGDRVEVYADRSQALPVVDPDDRALVISCGAAVATFVVALREHGFAGDVVLLPDPDDPDLLATIGPGLPHATEPRDHELFAAIERRRTHRSAFEDRPVPAEVLAAVVEDADRYGARAHLVVDEPLKRKAAALVAEGDRRQMADPRFRTELASWVRSNYSRRGDGMPGYAFGIPGPASLLGPVIMRRIDMGERQATKDEQLAATAPALVLLTTPADTARDWMAAGRALGTLLLTATAAGLAASFLNQPVESDALRGRLGDLLAPGETPQLLLRLGHPAKPYRPTPRRAVEAVLAR